MDLDIALLGLVFGIANGLLAAGLVLVYKSSRVINFAQGEFGAFTVAMMLALTLRGLTIMVYIYRIRAPMLR